LPLPIMTNHHQPHRCRETATIYNFISLNMATFNSDHRTQINHRTLTPKFSFCHNCPFCKFFDFTSLNIPNFAPNRQQRYSIFFYFTNYLLQFFLPQKPCAEPFFMPCMSCTVPPQQKANNVM